MNSFLALALTLLLSSVMTVAQAESGWKDSTGKLVADTDAQKSRDGFGGLVLITSDQDWEAKWNTAPEVAPQFSTTDQIERGQKVFVLIFFVNPKAGSSGSADVACDLRVTRPDGSISMNEKSAVCYAGPVNGATHHVRLAAPVIGFVGEPGDPAGRWVVEVALRDNVRSTELPLRTSFVLK